MLLFGGRKSWGYDSGQEPALRFVRSEAGYSQGEHRSEVVNAISEGEGSEIGSHMIQLSILAQNETDCSLPGWVVNG